MGSDKVFDIIGRQFHEASLSEIIMRAVVDDRADDAANQIEGILSAGQVRAIQEADAKLGAAGGDVASILPALLEQREQDQLHRLLPGNVRRFVEKSAARICVNIDGDLDGHFTMDRLPMTLALALEEPTEGRPLPMTVNRPEPEEQVIWKRTVQANLSLPVAS